MLTSAQMYWFTRLDQFADISSWLVIIGFVCLFGFAILSVIFFMHRTSGCENVYEVKDIPETILKTRRTAGTAAIVFLVLGATIRSFVPTTREMAAIYVIPKVVNNEKLNDVGDKLYNLAVEWMETLRPNAPNE